MVGREIIEGFAYQKTVNLSKPKTGQEIIDAMLSIENTGSDRYYISDDSKDILKIGFISLAPWGRMGVYTGEKLDKLEINPKATYSTFAIGRYFWEVESNIPFAEVDMGQNLVNHEIDEVVKDLENRLN